MGASRPSSLLGPLLGVAVVATLAIVVASGRPSSAAASAEPSVLESLSPSLEPTDVAPATPSAEPTLAPTASVAPASSQDLAAVPGRLPPFKWGPNLSGRCQSLIKVVSDVDPYQRVDVIFTGGRYVPKAEREVFAHDNGLEEIYVMLRFREWPGTYTAVFEYVIRDGRHPDAKVRDLLALPDVQEAYRPGLGGYGELVDVVTAAVTAPPEYSEDGFLPELWIRFKQPMSDLDVELFGVRYLLTQSGQRGDWYRFCEEGSVFPEQEREAVLTWPEVADVRFEVGKP